MILIVPDLFERPYVRELVNILLVQMGFKQACVQQVRSMSARVCDKCLHSFVGAREMEELIVF